MKILAAILSILFACGIAQAKDSFYRCKHDSSNEEISLAVRSDGTSTTILVRSRNGDRTYYVTKTTPVSYEADTKNVNAPEAFSSLELDRLSGDLRVQERIPNAVTKVLAEACKGNIPVSECNTMMSKVSAEHAFLCMTTQDGQCPRWTAGLNTFKGAARYLCRPTERLL